MPKKKLTIKLESCMQVQFIACVFLFIIYVVSKMLFPDFYLALNDLYKGIIDGPPLYNLDDIRKITQNVITFVNDVAQ